MLFIMYGIKKNWYLQLQQFKKEPLELLCHVFTGVILYIINK